VDSSGDSCGYGMGMGIEMPSPRQPWWRSVAAVDDFRRPDVCRRRSTQVRGQTKTRRQNMLVCSQHISVQETSATAANRQVALSGSSEEPSSGVLNGLNSSDKIVGHIIEQ